MAARDNVLFGAAIAGNETAGTVIPLSLMYGSENVRQGYGTPVLKNVRAFFAGCYTNSVTLNQGIPIKLKNSNWVDSAGLIANKFLMESSLSRDSLSFMRGRDKVLAPNTGWAIEAEIAANVSSAGYIYVLLEIEYSDVSGISTENTAGSPVMKCCKNASVTGAANTLINIGTFDNLLQNVTYVLSEVSTSNLSGEGGFVVVQGFSNQKGLIRIIPAKGACLAEQIEGSVYLLKQTYSIGVISFAALSAAPVTVNMELIASAN